MNQITKFVLTLIGTIIFIGLSACTPNAAINTNPIKVSFVVSDIANFDLPIGYSADFSASIMGCYSIAVFDPGDGHSHIYLIQSEKESDGEKLESMLAEMVPSYRDPQNRMTVIDTLPAMVRGQNVTLTISEGVDAEGSAYRQVTTVFQGKGGPALLVLSEPVTRWDQTKVNAFLASIN